MKTAVALIHEIELAGGRLAVNGDKLSVSAAAPLADNLMTALRTQKPEIMLLLKGWDPETARVIDWFLRTEPPAEPFPLYPHLTIIAPARWWEATERDIAAGPGVARAMYGSLQNDLRRLAELFDGPGAG
jgi:hypothetical protein